MKYIIYYIICILSCVSFNSFSQELNDDNSSSDRDFNCDSDTYYPPRFNEGLPDYLAEAFNKNDSIAMKNCSKSINDRILVNCTVNKKGKVTKVILLKGTQCKTMDAALINILRGISFVPAECEGGPIWSYTAFPLSISNYIKLDD